MLVHASNRRFVAPGACSGLIVAASCRLLDCYPVSIGLHYYFTTPGQADIDQAKWKHCAWESCFFCMIHSQSTRAQGHGLSGAIRSLS